MKKKFNNLNKRLIAVVLSIVMLFATMGNCFASYSISNAYIYNKGTVPYHLQANFGGSSYSYVITHYTVYSFNGIEYPAYCLNRELSGAETVGAYSVSVDEAVTNAQVYRVITNGFPYKSAAQLGVSNDYYAFQATKQAVYCVLYNFDPYTYFRGIDSEGNAIKNAICRLVEIGRSGGTGYVTPQAQINKQGELTEEEINGTKYQVQYCNVTGNCEFTTYDINISNFPEGTKVVNLSNIEQYSYSGNERFKLIIPNSNLRNDVRGIIYINNVKMKSFPILYGKTPNSAWQNYALASDPWETRESTTTLRINMPNIVVHKTERGTTKGLPGAEYDIYEDTNKNGKYDEGENKVTHTQATDNSGNVTITGLKIGSYVAVETKAPEGYNLDDIHQVFEVKANNDTTTVTSTDTPNVKIIKTERGTTTKLAGADYDIYEDINKNGKVDSEDVLVYTTEPTNNDGTTTIKSLSIGSFVTKEKKAPEGYNLDDVEHAFEITGTNNAITINSDDTIITSKIKISKLSLDDSEITGHKAGDGLKGAKFNISDINHKLIYENLETNENGDIVIDLRYGKYYIEEVKAPEYYLLYPNKEDNIKIIEVKKQGEIISVEFKNESIKVRLDIEKDGIVQAQPNDEIKYTFPTLENTSNVSLDNFTWQDVLPTDYIRLTKIFTGVYNEDLLYSVSVKTNKRDYFVAKEGLSTLTNNYIDISSIGLQEDEYVTEYKFNFGTVKKDFKAVETPFIFTKVNSTVKPTDKWTNTTKLSGNYKGVYLEDNDEHTVKSYGKKLSIRKLPKTGF